MGRVFRTIMVCLGVIASVGTGTAQPAQVLWWDATPPYEDASDPADRERMARYLDRFRGGALFDVIYRHSTRRGDLARALAGQAFDILVIDATTEASSFNADDLAAVQALYRAGRQALMLDGTLWIRSTRSAPETHFPGPNGAAAALLVNQLGALRARRGGILLGTDHEEYQVGANQVVRALLPGAAFSGRTNPSRDGVFIGDVLLSLVETARPLDILRHWESVPSQAQAPVGNFTDFLGNPVVLYPLVETADKPGGGPRRPYISASFAPGESRTAIDSAEMPEAGTMPTRKSAPVERSGE